MPIEGKTGNEGIVHANQKTLANLCQTLYTKRFSSEETDMGVWLKSPTDNKTKIYLSGALARLDFDQEDTNFFLELAVKPHDDGKLENVQIAKAVEANKDKKMPAVSARTVTCFHGTKPRSNIAAFYRRLSSTQIMLIGYGEHIGKDNLNYRVQWADGSTSTIYLKLKAKNGVEIMPYPKRLA